MLWTLWLIRNECIFTGKKINHSSIELLIKTRAWEWSVEKGIIDPEFKNQWKINPIHAYNHNANWSFKNLLERWMGLSKFVGFIDGAWKFNNDGSLSSGIGGYLWNSLGQIEFIFSGPCPNYVGWEVELNALLYLMEAISRRGLADEISIIATNSTKLVEYVNKCRASLISPYDFNSGHQTITTLRNVRLVHISRNLNKTADGLAK